LTLAVLGGTFNPVHLGHLILAQEVQVEFAVDLVLFVPAAVPAHKRAPEAQTRGASPEDRLRMLGMAIEGVPGFAIDDCELRRGGVSYTIETLADLSRRYPAAGRPLLVIGDDLLPGFEAWREPAAVAERARIVVAHREQKEETPFPYPHEYCHNSLVPISSSSVRERIAKGLPVRFLVPEAVRGYIESRGLYR
jgi:nicotinate-nucleotide adenylyltransferase